MTFNFNFCSSAYFLSSFRYFFVAAIRWRPIQSFSRVELIQRGMKCLWWYYLHLEIEIIIYKFLFHRQNTANATAQRHWLYSSRQSIKSIAYAYVTTMTNWVIRTYITLPFPMPTMHLFQFKRKYFFLFHFYGFSFPSFCRKNKSTQHKIFKMICLN